MTPEEAERAYDEAPAVPLTDKYINECVLRVLLAEKVRKVLDGIEYEPRMMEPDELAIANRNFGAEGVFAEGWGHAVDELRPLLEKAILRSDKQTNPLTGKQAAENVKKFHEAHPDFKPPEFE